jgi:peptidoglycan/xylan/chitin deacetylase (PgdA/CDA1 family)
MRQVSGSGLCLAALLMVVAVHPLYAEIEPGGAVNADACANDPKLLGLSRTVEVDTAGGGNIGGDQPSAKHLLNDGEVVLTFDDGPARADTKAILKALADECTKATFFMVGRMALSDPEMVKEVAAGGHTIGSHTWSHRNLRPASSSTARQEIESAISTISKAKGGPIAPLFRYPYLSANKQTAAYLDSRNIDAVWVDIDSKDYLTRSPKVAEQRILTELEKKKKGVILMHDIHAWTAAMLPDLLSELHDRGFKVVHLVPKADVDTIASFDAAAEKALAAKSAARVANPMAPRALTWTMSPAPKPSARHHRHSTHFRRISTKPTVVEGLPGVFN